MKKIMIVFLFACSSLALIAQQTPATNQAKNQNPPPNNASQNNAAGSVTPANNATTPANNATTPANNATTPANNAASPQNVAPAAASVSLAQNQGKPTIQVTPPPQTQQQPLGSQTVKTDDNHAQLLKTLLLSGFENAALWSAHMYQQEGSVYLKNIPSKGPKQMKTIANQPNENVLGVKIIYHRRSAYSIELDSVQPIAIPGVVQSLSVWVLGREVPDRLYVILKDYHGKQVKLPLVTTDLVPNLGFYGWQKLTAKIPDNLNHLDFRLNPNETMKFVGFELEPNVNVSTGTFYMYLDNLEALTNMYYLNTAKSDDNIQDNW